MDGNESRMDGTEGKKLSELEDRTIEVNYLKKKTENQQEKKRNTASLTCRIIRKDLAFISLEFWKEMRKRMGLKKNLKK